MSAVDFAIIAVLAAICILIVLKFTLFKGPKWLRDAKKESKTEKDASKKS